jgi:hypothetical protein
VSFESADRRDADGVEDLTTSGFWLTEKIVKTHVSSILGKLGLPLDGDTHRHLSHF